MKTIAAAILSLVLSLALAPMSNAAEHCTAATVRGHYGFTFSGFVQDGNGNNIPFAGGGTATLDGQGNVTATVNASTNGSFQSFPYTGTAVINPDCSGLVTSTDGNANFSTVAVHGGGEIFAVATNPGETWTMDLKRIE